MGYLLLTGATGLLGRYLLKDLFLAGVPTAVLVRPSRRASGAARIENVMRYWEGNLGRSLPRPVVLEGEITESELGLDPRALRWIARHCDALLHNAASLTFESTSSQGEPWKSNVEGTRNVLEVCRAAGIRQFHHVSTAYICGLRQGRILESEVDVGQQLSNDYERSKLKAELMVRSAEMLDSLTVYRPAIIVGDSKNGHTTTYHGFYAPLQAVSAISHAFSPNETGLIQESARFAISENETKNLVPVDWVSQVMVHVVTHPEHHGQTYHLTPRHPIQVRLLGELFEEAIGWYGVKLEGSGRTLHGLTEYEQLFAELIRVYSSYWKDDPVFDASNTLRAAPHLPCPHLDRKLLRLLADYAISVNFTSPRDKPFEPVLDASRLFEPYIDSDSTSDANGSLARLGLRLLGEGGGDWTVAIADEEPVAAEPGLQTGCQATLECETALLAGVVEGRISAEQLLASSDSRWTGGGIALGTIARVLKRLCAGSPSRVVA